MRNSAALLMAAVATAWVASAAAQPSCHTTPTAIADLHADSLPLYDRDGQHQGSVSRAALGGSFDITDCGDMTYVMIAVGAGHFLVRRIDLRLPKLDSGCVCLPAGGGPSRILGLPGAGDLKYCPASSPRCPR